VEPLPFEQAPGVLGTGDRGKPPDSWLLRQAPDEGGYSGGTDALAARRRGEAVADLDAALAVGQAMGPQIAEDPSVGYVGSNPTPATTCETARWLRKRSPAGCFLLVTACIKVCH
jgi:hypothetical protein